MSMSDRLKKTIAIWRRQKVKIIGVVGKRKAGKDVFVDCVMKNYRGLRHVRIADAPLLIAKILYLPADRRVYHALFGVNALLYPILKESAFKRRAAIILDREKPHQVIVEALRTKEEYREFIVKRKGILIAIAAADDIRYQRALKDAKQQGEKRDEGKMTFREFMAKEASPIEREIAYIMKKAHSTIRNDYKTHRPFHQKIREALAPLGLKKKYRKW